MMRGVSQIKCGGAGRETLCNGKVAPLFPVFAKG